jgi:hypothetical protein
MPLEWRGVLDPLGKWQASLDAENQTSHPVPGQMLLYAAVQVSWNYSSLTEHVAFSSKIGPLAGNHLIPDPRRLMELGLGVLGL